MREITDSSHQPQSSKNLELDIDPSQFFPFELDDFQLEAMKHLDAGKSVVVCAPTGAGKTVIAEYAVELALASNKRCFYTTPLKALSNQKLYDLRKKYSDEKVGLLTGDTSVNRDAPIVVMTTEVFRNMLYGTILGDVRRNLKDVSFVILDECHYMNDSERGTVWEESIIYSPVDIQLVPPIRHGC
ncbi:MAG: DEAD/DEAH box helicase [Cyanobacteriota/Melainabacteria group bacterium]